ncbi:MAG TPA: hypothetical protein VGD54_19850 [Steroidobacteraceae bacterium]
MVESSWEQAAIQHAYYVSGAADLVLIVITPDIARQIPPRLIPGATVISASDRVPGLC